MKKLITALLLLFATQAYSITITTITGETFERLGTTSIYTDSSGFTTEWLHLGETTGLSFNQVMGNSAYRAYRHATRSEIGAITNALFGFNLSELIGNPHPSGYTELTASFFGYSHQAAVWYGSFGLTGDAVNWPNIDPSHWGLGIESQYGIPGSFLWGSGKRDTTALSDVGHFLVRKIPEPATITLMSVGLTGIGHKRRRSKIAA